MHQRELTGGTDLSSDPTWIEIDEELSAFVSELEADGLPDAAIHDRLRLHCMIRRRRFTDNKRLARYVVAGFGLAMIAFIIAACIHDEGRWILGLTALAVSFMGNIVLIDSLKWDKRIEALKHFEKRHSLSSMCR